MIGFFKLFWQILPDLLSGLQVTLELWGISLVFGFLGGLLLALARVYGAKPIYYVATGWIEFIRGTPLLVQLFIVYYGLGDIGILFSPFVAASIALIINTSAYQAEYIRGAIQSIESGQRLAAESIGMSKIQMIRHIVFPQAFRIVIPPCSNEWIVMLKFTSLAFLVTVQEMMTKGEIIANRTFEFLQVYGILAIIYLVVVLFFTYFLDLLEEKLRVPGLGVEGSEHTH